MAMKRTCSVTLRPTEQHRTLDPALLCPFAILGRYRQILTVPVLHHEQPGLLTQQRAAIAKARQASKHLTLHTHGVGRRVHLQTLARRLARRAVCLDPRNEQRRLSLRTPLT